MILRVILLLFFCTNSLIVSAQDERLIREYFTNKNLAIREKQKLDKDYFFKVNSPIYRIDLNSDNKKEMIIWVMNNILKMSWIIILNCMRIVIVKFSRGENLFIFFVNK